MPNYEKEGVFKTESRIQKKEQVPYPIANVLG